MPTLFRRYPCPPRSRTAPIQILIFIIYLLLIDAGMMSGTRGLMFSVLLMVANAVLIGFIFYDTRQRERESNASVISRVSRLEGVEEIEMVENPMATKASATDRARSLGAGTRPVHLPGARAGVRGAAGGGGSGGGGGGGGGLNSMTSEVSIDGAVVVEVAEEPDSDLEIGGAAQPAAEPRIETESQQRPTLSRHGRKSSQSMHDLRTDRFSDAEMPRVARRSSVVQSAVTKTSGNTPSVMEEI